MAALKAWRVSPSYDYAYSQVVFAETRGKAKDLAMRTDVCEDCSFTEIRVTRVPGLDSEYRGRWEMDWYDPYDRRALVREGWMCENVYDEDCLVCHGNDYCQALKDWRQENGKGEGDFPNEEEVLWT